MPDNEERPDTGSRLRREVDDLAMQLLLGDEQASPAGFEDLLATLARVGEEARRSGWSGTARVAGELAASADTAALREGLSRLERALEEDARHEAPPAAAPPGTNPLAQDRELLADFVVEARDHLAAIEARSLELERNPTQSEAIHSLFRSFHTLKGLAGFLEIGAIQEVAHDVETGLDLARNAQLDITPALIDLILQCADYVKRAVDAVDARLAGQPAQEAEDNRPLLARLRAALEHPGEAPAPQTAPEKAPAPAPAAARRKTENFTVRVDTNKLDYLMDMVGEMVIAQSMVRNDPLFAGALHPNLLRNLSQLARVTGEVQRTAMAMRMIPIGQVFQRTARLVRDLSRKAGKRVEMETRGDDTELDKSIAEELADPLLHMVRNSVDHGIEDPEERRAAGKSERACVRLAAYHQGGRVIIEVTDDGRGLDREKILRKAREKGLIDTEPHTDAEVFNLIFEPGFSTAAQVTDVSGRGVGMDVVRKHVQKLRGRIEVTSERGKGSTFLLKLPLTLAIIEGLIVGVGPYRYIVPIYTVRELFRPTPDMMSTVRGTQEMALVHERLLPVVKLHERFNVRPRFEDPCEAVMVVTENDGRMFCLMVDEVIGKQEVVIKSLGEKLKNIRGVAGATILGDGRVGLILDVNGIGGVKADG